MKPPLLMRAKAGMSRFIPAQSPAERHRQRLSWALKCQEEMQSFCNRYGITFTLIDHERFVFVKRSRRIDWWPQIAHLMLDEKWTDVVQVHDWDQCKYILNQYLVKKVKGNNRKWFITKRANIKSDS